MLIIRKNDANLLRHVVMSMTQLYMQGMNSQVINVSTNTVGFLLGPVELGLSKSKRYLANQAPQRPNCSVEDSFFGKTYKMQQGC